MERKLRIRVSNALVVGGLAAVFFGVVGYVMAYKTPPHAPFWYSQDVFPIYPSGAFRFSPKPDITPYELAVSMVTMFGSSQILEAARPLYDQMPPEVKRHWIAKPPAEPGPQVPEPKK